MCCDVSSEIKREQMETACYAVISQDKREEFAHLCISTIAPCQRWPGLAARHRSGTASSLQPGYERAFLLQLQQQEEGTSEILKSSIFVALVFGPRLQEETGDPLFCTSLWCEANTTPEVLELFFTEGPFGDKQWVN